jgi:outer membrane protein assembly factor BamB
MSSKFIKILVAIFLLMLFVVSVSAGDWTEFRGPNRDGISNEKNLPTKWSPSGENLAWRVPYGGRSTPVVFGNRVYLQNPTMKVGETTEGLDSLQERVMCLNADTGKVIWEYRYNIYLSDAPPHRIAWASPAVDAATGNVYVMSAGGELMALSPQGKLLWERSLGEEVGFLTTHGGRIVSPIIDGDLVIVSGITFSWGTQGRGQHRFMAFNKKTGECYWSSNFATRPYDTTYAPPIIATVNGMRLLIQGASDGFVYALKPQTGELVWKYEVSKRGLNTGVLVKDNISYITHSEENLASSEMGMLSALDAGMKGEIKLEQAKYNVLGWQGGFSSPVIDGNVLYQIDNGANLAAFDLTTGKQLWIQNLGTIQKASLVMGDGKLYVGTENGKFFILKPNETGCEILDQDQLGTEEKPEAILASVAISNGRVFLVSDTATYCIGRKAKPSRPTNRTVIVDYQHGPISYVQVAPTELILKPGEKVKFDVRLFDANGVLNFAYPSLPDFKVTFSLDGLKGTIADNGEFTASSEQISQVGQVKATVNGIEGIARVRVFPSELPLSENFDSIAVNSLPTHWVNTTLKYIVREVNGNKVLVKLTEGTSLLSRARAYMGADWYSNYTTEADVYATEKRRSIGDAGVIAQRYSLVLFGNDQKLELTPWQPEVQRRVRVPFAWKKDTWYRMKLQVENLPNGKVRARGKVWAVGEQEPTAWMIERVDPIGNHRGSPGIFGNSSQGGEIYFDNIKVMSNK